MRLQNLVVLALAVLAVGCAKPEAQVIGKWQIDPASISTGNAQQDAKMAAYAKRVVLEFKPDKTFTGPMMEGTYVVADHAVTMTTMKFGGMEVSKMGAQAAAGVKPQTVTLSADGKSLTMPSQNGKAVKFVKSTGS